jgi:hypothetical protein
MPDHLPQIPRTPMTAQTAAMAFLACAAYASTMPRRDPSVRVDGGMMRLAQEQIGEPVAPVVRLKPGGGWASCSVLDVRALPAELAQ